jgi:hypothetical protein
MKMAKLAVGVLVFVLAANTLFAQGRNGQIELYGGIAFPTKPDEFKDYFKNGLSLHGQYVAFPSPQLGISFGAAYERFSFDEDAFLSDLEDQLGVDLSGVSIDGSASVIEFGVGLRPYLTQPEASTQFFLFGMGTYNILKTEITVSAFGESESAEGDEKKFGIAAGAGLEFPAGSTMNIIVQGLFRLIFTEEESTSFIGVTGGLVF